jgi:hypothetical protein
MFRGSATLMRKNPQIMWVVWGVGGGMVLITVLAVLLLPAHLKRTAGIVVPLAMLGVYPPMLSRALTPKRVPVNLTVDQSGVYADDAPLVRREDITQAYIRPALDQQVHRHVGYRSWAPMGAFRFSITTPDYPLTVEMMTRRGQVNIDPGGEGPATQILSALGVPVTTCPPNYRPGPSRSMRAVSVVMVALFLAAFFAYYLFMAHRTMHH